MITYLSTRLADSCDRAHVSRSRRGDSQAISGDRATMAYNESGDTGLRPHLGLLAAAVALLLGPACREVIVMPPELPATAQPQKGRDGVEAPCLRSRCTP